MIGIWILGDQLNLNQAALQSCFNQKMQTPVILIESETYVKDKPYHQQKLVLIWSAMRHFFEELKQEGWPVTYHISDDFFIPLREWIEENQITELRIMMPSNRPFYNYIDQLNLTCQVNFIPNNHFIWKQKKTLNLGKVEENACF